jgi:Cof subfamily protein (haloacid dehalogenase superfamily)
MLQLNLDIVTASPIRLVAIDLDGTLLNDSRQVSQQTAGALACLPARGVKVVLASARPPRSVRHVYRSLALDTLQINYNGAMIWDEVHSRVNFHQPLEPEVAREVIAQAREEFPQVLVSCEVYDRWLTDRVDPQYLTETSRLFPPDGILPVEAMCAEPVTKVLLMGEPEMISELRARLVESHPHVSLVRSDPDLIQIMHPGVNKGTALKLVADHYTVPMSQVLAIGDATNDLPMLAAAGVKVAMDNAPAEVKAAADWVAPSNNDHGVHAALVRFGLCE